MTLFLIILVVAALGVGITTAFYYSNDRFKYSMDQNYLDPLKKWWAVTFTKRNRSALTKKRTERFTETSAEEPTEENRKQSSGISINPILLFFAWYGGSDVKLLKNLPTATIGKRAAFGFAMFASVILSAIIAATVWTDIKGPTFGIATAFIWFFVMTGIERAVMIFMDHDAAKESPNKAKLVVIIAARFLLIFAISSINARMIEMQIFSDEIKADIANQRQLQLNHLTDSVNKSIAVINTQKDEYQKNYDDKNTIYQNALGAKQQEIATMRDSLMSEQNKLNGEIEGIVGSHLLGYGPAAEAKKQALVRDSVMIDKMTAALDSSKRTMPEYLALQQALKDKNAGWAQADAQIAQIRASEATKVAELKSAKMDGLNDRYHALERISADSSFMTLFFCLFFAFEALPIILKMMMGKDLLTNAIRLQGLKHAKDHHHDALIEMQTAQNSFEARSTDLKTQKNLWQKERLGQLYNAQSDHIEQIGKNIQNIKDSVNDIDTDFDAKQQLIKKFTNETVYSEN
jgi:hypothetical protein